jgi:hypothetical protein
MVGSVPNRRRDIVADRKYEFSWSLLGDLELGRPNLGPHTRLEKTDQLFYKAGELAGREFYSQYLSETGDFHTFVRELQRSLQEMGIGILRVEEADPEAGTFILTVSEDLDCSGLPELGYEICTYDEGFIAGLLESFTGGSFAVKEVDCWCTGDRTCRFTAEAVGS